ncbi:hypothetical protein [Aquimarina algiphila]|uniref:hypothetical protein n=1 Tax=Aquimarina algiphila TaxID=2047982 RepID=UPI00232BB1B0|nr:hypothetical protein [Aquimarina algiphila]
MKTKSFLKSAMLIAVLISGIMIISCEKDNETPVVENKQSSYLSTGSPKNVLDLGKAQHLFDNYEKRAIEIQNYEKQFKGDFLTSRSVTFDYQELKNYLDYIEKYADKADIPIKGLRFYFGKYPYDHYKYPGQQMLFFNPTIHHTLKDGSIKEVAYAIDESESELKIRILNELDHTIPQNQKSSLKNSNLTSMIEQGGQVSPPDGN